MANEEADLSKATNDLDLDAVVHLDEAWHQEGFEEGKEAGRQRGHKEGKAVGKAKGFEIGCELGYYKACCQTWLAVLRREEKETEEEEEAEEGEATKEIGGVGLVMDTTTKKRAIRTMEGIVKLVNGFPRHNAADIDMAEQVQRLRAKFRAAASMLGVSVAFALHKCSRRGPDGEAAAADEGLSF